MLQIRSHAACAPFCLPAECMLHGGDYNGHLSPLSGQMLFQRWPIFMCDMRRTSSHALYLRPKSLTYCDQPGQQGLKLKRNLVTHNKSVVAYIMEGSRRTSVRIIDVNVVGLNLCIVSADVI